ncbi:MAG: AraC family transcriptional regulator [Verrucomicrobiaceae bacterium]|nr:AraC family transcriptional regulator [Verrucomicrobiaceae bacterium]
MNAIKTKQENRLASKQIHLTDGNSSLDQILAIANKRIQTDGSAPTIIPFLSFIRSSKPTLLNQGILTPSFCMIAQGRKKLHLGSDIIQYGAGDYSLATIDMPTSGQIVGASKSAPYLGVRIDLDPKEIAAVVIDAKINIYENKKPVAGAFVRTSDPELRDVILKLLKTLDKPHEAAFLGSALKREIIYRLLTGEDGHLFYQNILFEHQNIGIGKAIHWIKENFKRPIKIELLAKSVNMSISSLQHKFKAVTTMGPLQYQKQLRLQEARRLLLAGGVDASTAAYQVGYASHSQFTREYRRLFGAPPLKDVKTMTLNSTVEKF